LIDSGVITTVPYLLVVAQWASKKDWGGFMGLVHAAPMGAGDYGTFIELLKDEYVVTVVVPFLVTLTAILINWAVQGAPFKPKYAMIGTDLVLCFLAVATIHFFRTVGQSAPALDMRALAAISATFIMALMTLPTLIICIVMEQASHTSQVPVTWRRAITNLLVGASPLVVAVFATAS
jgi:hypothetical protein